MMKFYSFFIMSLVSLVSYAQSSWKITANHFDTNRYFGVTVANGMLGLVSSTHPLKTDCVVLAGSYDKFGRGDVSNFLRGFNMLNTTLSIDGNPIDINNADNYGQELNMKQAIFTGHFDYKDKASVSYSILALRQLPYCAMMVVDITPRKDIEIQATNMQQLPNGFKNGYDIYENYGTKIGVVHLQSTEADSPTGKLKMCASSAFMFPDEKENKVIVTHQEVSGGHSITFQKTLKQGQKYRFCVIGSTLSSAIHPDPINEVKRYVLYCSLEGTDKLLSCHIARWNDLWKSDIEIEGDVQSQQDIHSMLYHLYSFVREGSSLSISPMGLSGLGYNGHVFWDADTWMFPALLLLHPELAKSMIDYRFDRLSMARQNAFAHGYKGAQYPWESADSGCEDTPVFAMSGPFEQSITGCVGFAAWQYYCVTRDKDWLRKKGYPILQSTADFWVSRVSEGKDGKDHILNVVASDEWAENVDDDAFTNGVAKVDLLCAVKAAHLLGEPVNKEWKEVAEKIAFHSFPDGITKEYSNYDGRNIKQADVNLLAFPLRLITDKEQIKKDLKYYQTRVPNQGTPAMTQAIFALLYSRMGDSENAWKYFQDAYIPNMTPPFRLIAEGKGGTNPYFATGAGGVLQSVLMGFGGLQIMPDGGITQVHSVLPKAWKKLVLKGIGLDKKQYTIVNH